MGFYDLSKEERKKLVNEIKDSIKMDLEHCNFKNIRKYASNEDTYIRKYTYLSIGKLYRDREDLRDCILTVLKELFEDRDEKVRQTVVYALGEIGKIDAESVFEMLDRALNDEHHSVRNAVIGALKQMGEKNPVPTLKYAKKFLHHPDPKVRREIIHGIELRGRTHPEDILPLLAELQNDPDRNVKKTIVHVLAQISYKEGCLEKVVSALKKWENKELVERAIKEILEVHKRYEKFSAKSFEGAKEYIREQMKIYNL